MAPEVTCDEFGNCFPSGGCPEGVDCDGPGRPSTLTAALWDRGSNAMAGSLVTAVGWTSDLPPVVDLGGGRSEEHTSELQSLMRNSYAVFCLQKKTTTQQ